MLRLLQGLSAAGEQAGANSMTLEHAPPHRRAYYTSFTLSGTQAGQILATAAFLPVAALPEDALLSWGWRVPFWASAVVVAVGYVIRRRLEETPVFEQQVATDGVAQLPVVDLFRDHWRDVLRVVCAAVIASVSTIFTVYALSYAVNTVELDTHADAVGRRARQRRRARRAAAVRDARRPDRPQAGLHRRLARLRGADVRLPRRDLAPATTR